MMQRPCVVLRSLCLRTACKAALRRVGVVVSHTLILAPMRQGSAGVCLADACEALHCDALAALAPGWAHSPADPYSRHAPCRASAAARHRRMCEVGKDAWRSATKESVGHQLAMQGLSGASSSVACEGKEPSSIDM